MSTFGDRLKEERKRLGKNQVDFGELGGVSKRAQINYEKGDRQPDSKYLESLELAGVDVNYLLTGRRIAEEAANIFNSAKRSALANERTNLLWDELNRLSVNEGMAVDYPAHERMESLMEDIATLDEGGLQAIETMVAALKKKK